MILPRNDNRDIVGEMAVHLRAGGIDLADDTAALMWLTWGRFKATEVCAYADCALQLAREQVMADTMGMA